jgi:hypothetical protein
MSNFGANLLVERKGFTILACRHHAVEHGRVIES